MGQEATGDQDLPGRLDPIRIFKKPGKYLPGSCLRGSLDSECFSNIYMQNGITYKNSVLQQFISPSSLGFHLLNIEEEVADITIPDNVILAM